MRIKETNLGCVLTRCAAVLDGACDAKFVKLGDWYAALPNPPGSIGRDYDLVGEERENNLGMTQGVFDYAAVNGHEVDRIG